MLCNEETRCVHIRVNWYFLPNRAYFGNERMAHSWDVHSHSSSQHKVIGEPTGQLMHAEKALI